MATMAPPPVTIQFADDYTGENVNIKVHPHQFDQKVSALVAGTAMATNGFLTSVQLLDHRAGIDCKVIKDDQIIAEANGDSDNYAQFGRTAFKNLEVLVKRI